MSANSFARLGFTILLFLVVPVTLSAAVLFKPVKINALGDSAFTIAAADLNGDGKADLLLGDYGLVGIALGNGDGTFGPVTRYAAGGSIIYSLAVGDLNGDGIPDIAAINCGPGCPSTDGVVGILLGNGDGTFRPVQTYDSGAIGGYSIAVADVNLDGKPDLLVGNQCPATGCSTWGQVTLLLGNGDGTFQPAVIATAALAASSIVAADFNGDGKPDFAASGGVVLGNGDGTFLPPLFGGFGSFISVGDLNGDGRPDVVSTGACYSRCRVDSVFVSLNNGDGTFHTGYYDAGGIGTATAAIGDFNLDGKLDLVAASCARLAAYCNRTETVTTKEGLISVRLGNGDGTFSDTLSRYYTGGHNAFQVVVADLQGYGKSDVLVLNFWSGTVSAFLSTAKFPTLVSLASSVNPSTQGQAVTFTATVTASGPNPVTGSVVFKNGTTSFGTATVRGGVATLTTTKLPVGTLSISAKYAGSSLLAKSSSAVLTQVVNPAP